LNLKREAFCFPFCLWKNYKKLPFGVILTSIRVVFNIKGNDYRLIVDIEYKLKIVFIVWFSTHSEYDKIDAKKISYEN